MDQDELTKMSKQKAVFTRKLGELEEKIENFHTVPLSQNYEEQCFTAAEALRERYKNVVLSYEEIQTKVTDEIWKSTFERKMNEVMTNFKRAEKSLPESWHKQERAQKALIQQGWPLSQQQTSHLA